MAATDMAVVGAPSAGGDLGSAPAPGPGAGAPPADVLFTLTATGANLSAEKLVLTGVADTALFSSASRQTGVYTTGMPLSGLVLAVLPLPRLWLFGLPNLPGVIVLGPSLPAVVASFPSRNSGGFIIYPVCNDTGAHPLYCAEAACGPTPHRRCSQPPALRAAAFTNTTAGSEFVSRNGRWLSDPVVLLRANSSSALLQLANPVYDAAAKTVTFKVPCNPTSRACLMLDQTCCYSVAVRDCCSACLFKHCLAALVPLRNEVA